MGTTARVVGVPMARGGWSVRVSERVVGGAVAQSSLSRGEGQDKRGVGRRSGAGGVPRESNV